MAKRGWIGLACERLEDCANRRVHQQIRGTTGHGECKCQTDQLSDD
jgi:hypothetical protein